MTNDTKQLRFPRPGGLVLAIKRHDFSQGRSSLTAYIADDSARFIAYAHSSDYHIGSSAGAWIGLWIGPASFDLSSAEAEQVRAFIGETRNKEVAA